MNWWQRRPDSGIAVAPSILAADFSRLREEISDVDKAGADLIHLDVMDGHFVPNLTFGPVLVESVRKVTELKLIAHLMIENPDKFIDEFARSGADGITIHAEASSDIGRDLRLIRARKLKSGIALNPDTPLDKVKSFLEDIDVLLVMSVFPGYCGQKFIKDVLPKLEEAAKIRERDRLSFVLEIDGGINGETAKFARDAGAEILVAGTAVFKSKNYFEAINMLRGRQ